MKKRPRITQAEKKIIAERLAKGIPVVSIAEEMGRDPQGIRAQARAMGFAVPSVNYVTEEAKTKIADLFHQGMSDAAIAKELGYGESTIRNTRLRMDLRRKDMSPVTQSKRSAFEKLRMQLITGAWV